MTSRFVSKKGFPGAQFQPPPSNDRIFDLIMRLRKQIVTTSDSLPSIYQRIQSLDGGKYTREGCRSRKIPDLFAELGNIVEIRVLWPGFQKSSGIGLYSRNDAEKHLNFL